MDEDELKVLQRPEDKVPAMDEPVLEEEETAPSFILHDPVMSEIYE